MREPLIEYESESQKGEGEFVENYDATPCSVHWKPMGIKLKVPNEEWPEIAKVAKMNPSVKVHGKYGFTVGKYHEFVVSDTYEYSVLRFAGSIVTVGSLTPLARFLLRGEWDSGMQGDIEYSHSIRLQNVPEYRLEQTLLTALDAFSKESKVTIRLKGWVITEQDYEAIERIYGDEDIEPLPPLREIVKDILPVRLLYYGEREAEEVSAFLQFYRILEYYAHALTVNQLYKLKRTRRAQKTFAKGAGEILRRKEEENLLQLLDSIGCKRVATQALRNRVLDGGTVKELCRKLYKFRNSVVHSKEDFRADINVQSPLEEHTQARQWKEITRALAVLAMRKYAEKYKR